MTAGGGWTSRANNRSASAERRSQQLPLDRSIQGELPFSWCYDESGWLRLDAWIFGFLGKAALAGRHRPMRWDRPVGCSPAWPTPSPVVRVRLRPDRPAVSRAHDFSFFSPRPEKPASLTQLNTITRSSNKLPARPGVGLDYLAGRLALRQHHRNPTFIKEDPMSRNMAAALCSILATLALGNTGCIRPTLGPMLPIPIPVSPYFQDKKEDEVLGPRALRARADPGSDHVGRSGRGP